MVVVDLFCGSGGVTAGMIEAMNDADRRAEISHAVNHWDLAVQVHGRNFPGVQVHQEDITKVTARDFGLEKTGINLLWASPSCVHHSRARGGKPREDQQRAHAWEVVDRWLKVTKVDVLLVENVPEFVEWGPLDDSGQPIKARKGEDFRAFVAQLEGLGYVVDHRVLCAADYGDPTIRRRFFLQAVRDGVPITWPKPSHRDPKKALDLFSPELPPWRPAHTCIKWDRPIRSIFDPTRRPLAEKTMARIAAGIRKYVLNGKPFLVNLTHGGRVEDLDEPFKTVTGANRGEKAVVSAAMLNLRGTSEAHVAASAAGADEPLHTISAGGLHHGVVAASLIQYHDETSAKSRVSDLKDPLPTLDTSNRYGVAAAVLKHYGGVVGQPADEPLGTVTAKDHHSVLAATLVGVGGRAGQSRPRGIDEPHATVTTKGDTAVVAATLIQTSYGEREGQAPRTLDIEAPLGTVVAGGQKHSLVAASLIGIDNGSGAGVWSAEDPLSTTTTKARHALVSAFLMKYNGTLNLSGLDEPLHTITTKDRHGLVTVTIEGETYAIVDIGMRMLEPDELAKAHSLPPEYKFERSDGEPLSKAAMVKMIGNMVPVEQAKALVLNVLNARPWWGRVAV